ARGDREAARGDERRARRSGNGGENPPRRRPGAVRQHARRILRAAARGVRQVRRDRQGRRREGRLRANCRSRASGNPRFLAAIAALTFAIAAHAWPDHAVRIIATSPPGGAVDLLARIAAEEFAREYGQPFVVENRPGANGNIGVEAALQAPADGHVLFVAPPGPFSINAQLMPAMPFNPRADIAPVALLG